MGADITDDILDDLMRKCCDEMENSIFGVGQLLDERRDRAKLMTMIFKEFTANMMVGICAMMVDVPNEDLIRLMHHDFSKAILTGALQMLPEYFKQRDAVLAARGGKT